MNYVFRWSDFWRKPTVDVMRQRMLQEAEASLTEAVAYREYYTAMERMLNERIMRLRRELQQ